MLNFGHIGSVNLSLRVSDADEADFGKLCSRFWEPTERLLLPVCGRRYGMAKVALVAGANGIIGKALMEEIGRTAGWSARAVSRRPHGSDNAIACDLTDADGTRSALAGAMETTYLFYAAYAPGGGLATEDQVNGAMLRNLLDGLKAVGAPIERVVLYQGAKIYGVNLGPVPAPFYEDDNPRHLGPNFYQTQEDELRTCAEAGGPSWSILRPDVVIGDAAGNAMNIATVVGAFAALSNATGAAFRFPGTQKVYEGVFAQMTDAHSLARASLWAATADRARNEAFNYVHEPFRWRRIWEKVAAAFDLEAWPADATDVAPAHAAARGSLGKACLGAEPDRAEL